MHLSGRNLLVKAFLPLMSLALLGSTASLAEQTGKTIALRGSTSTYSPAMALELRGSDDSHISLSSRSGADPYPDDTAAHGGPSEADTLITDVDSRQEGFLTDVGHTASYLRRNIVSTIMFRGPKLALSDRNMSYFVPGRASLRHSMMHRANVYEGLRGGEAGVGDTVALALRGSYSTRAQSQRASADRARMHGAIANFLPKVSATISANYNSEEGSTNFNSRIGQVTGGVEVSMPLYTSGVNINSYRQAKHLSIASDLSYLAEEHRVALEAITAHVNLRLNRKVESTLKSNVKAMQRIAHIANRLYEAGDASRTDIAIARANVESARSEVDLARKTREEIQSDYESLTGIQAPAELARSGYESFVPEDVEQAVAMAISNNPTLESSMHNALASGYAAKVERGRFGPRVDLFGGYNEPLYQETEGNEEGDWSVGVRLRMPLIDTTMVPNVNAARHTALEAQYRALDQSRIIERQVRRQWTAYRSADRRVSIVRRQIRAIRVSVEGSRREYEAGFRSITDVLNDQLKLARAQITLESVRHEKMLAAYEIAFVTANPAIRELASTGNGY